MGSLHTMQYMLDTKYLLKRNNMSVFVDGLIDKSSMGKSIPIIASLPHFLDADPSFVRDFNTKPNARSHGTTVSISLVFMSSYPNNRQKSRILPISDDCDHCALCDISDDLCITETRPGPLGM